MLSPEDPHTIRWRKGEIIGAGAYGRVYMGMNLDSGELLAIKQILIAVDSATKEITQAHIRDLEEEVRLLRNLSHPNIVRYLGTARDDEALNILLEFVSGGSIASLLGKFGSFTEPVIRIYSKQLLLGLEYLHSNNILHRDIKGANILVDNKGCIKLADFGVSKKAVELATISEAKSMKDTHFWMAPKVIRQNGHDWQGDIWSVGCTIIEMATGKPQWIHRFQEKTCCVNWQPWSLLFCKLPSIILHSVRSKAAALFHIRTTRSHPPIPEHLSPQAKDFLLKCLHREPKLRPSASELLKHPFVAQCTTEEFDASRLSQQPSADCNVRDMSDLLVAAAGSSRNSVRNASSKPAEQYSSSGMYQSSILKFCQDVESDYKRRETYYTDDMDYSVRFDSVQSDLHTSEVEMPSVRREFLTQSFNPMFEPSFMDGGAWENNLTTDRTDSILRTSDKEEEPGILERGNVGGNGQDDDEGVTKSIRAFLNEKAQELKRLQTPLYEELYNRNPTSESGPSISFITPLSPPARHQSVETSSKSPSKAGSFSASWDSEASISSGSPNATGFPSVNFSPMEVTPPRIHEWKGLHDAQVQHSVPPSSPSLTSSERRRVWREELQQELQRKRDEKRKLTRQNSAFLNPTQSPIKGKYLQNYGSRPASVNPTLKQPSIVPFTLN